MELDFSTPSAFCDSRRPMMSYDPQHRKQVEAAYNRHDWRKLNQLGTTWYDKYGERWHKFGPFFWDA